MKTQYILIDRKQIDEEAIEKAGAIIRNGGLVAFPTETVYGLGGDGLNADASGKIYAAKGRPSDNPLIIHIAEMSALSRIASYIPDAAYTLANRFWPGPLTMIFKKTDEVPRETTGGLDTVAVRMPSDEVARAFIKAAGGYVAAPSANLSGRPSPTSGAHVLEDMDGRIEMILDGGSSQIGLESTIVDLTSDVPMVLRPGFVSIEMVREALGEAEYDPAIMSGLNSNQAPKAPGMKYKHYAPKGDLTIVSGEKQAVVDYIKAEINKHSSDTRIGVIASDETYCEYNATVVTAIGSMTDEEAVARHLYGVLRDFDTQNIDLIYSEEFRIGQLGQAIMNRLMKAAGHQVIEVK